MMRDIAIAGGGVAGLASAALLARAGHRVTLYEQTREPQPIGSGLILQPVGMAVLDALGAGEAMRARGAPIARLFGLSAQSKAVVLDVRYAALGGAHGLGAHRGALFHVLLEAAQRSTARFEPGRTVTAAPLRAGGRRALAFADGSESAAFDLVLDCLGVRSPLSRPGAPLAYGALWANLPWRAGFRADALEQRYWRASKMAGVMPIGARAAGEPAQAAYFWSLRADAFERWRAAPLDAWKDEARTLWPETAPLLDHLRAHDDLVFARYAHRTLAAPAETGLAHVGDSYHCTSPQLGQGANMALLDAAALAAALARQDDLELALWDYARMRAAHVWAYQTASFLFTPVYQSDSRALPWLRDRIVGPLAKIWPAPQVLAALVSGAIGAPLGTIGAFGAAPEAGPAAHAA